MHLRDLFDEEEEEQGVTVIPLATGDVLDDETGENALLALIPLQSGSSNKAEYLAKRIIGFGVKEACDLVGITIQTVHQWKRTDDDFAAVEKDMLSKPKWGLLKDIQLMWFSRNMALVYHIDYKILKKAAASLKSLMGVEYDWIKSAQSRYNPKNLIDLERALQPEGNGSGGTNISGENVLVYVDGRLVDSEAAKRAGARELLDRFRVNKRSLEGLEEAEDDSSS